MSRLPVGEANPRGSDARQMAHAAVLHTVPDPWLTLVTLGQARLYPGAADPDHPRPVAGPGKRLPLITYLACSPSRSPTREQFLNLLQANVDPETGPHRLREAVHELPAIAKPGLKNTPATPKAPC